MKQSQNNLGVILTYAVPTAAALLGLLWLLRRKKDKDDDGGDNHETDASKNAQKERSGIVAAPSTLPRERHIGDGALDKQKGAPAGVGVADSSAQKTSPKQARPGAGIMKTHASDGKALGAGDNVKSSVLVSTSSTVVTSSAPVSSDRYDQSAAAAHSSKVSSVLSSILPASATGSGKDPVQMLVSRNEDKLKQDDASIVQAKLSTSTLQSLPPNSSRTSSSPSSSPNVSQASIPNSSSPTTQETLFAKEIVQGVLTQAAQVHAQSLGASTQVNTGPCATDSTTTLSKENKPSSATPILKESAKDTRLESCGRVSGTSLESVGADSKTSGHGYLADRNSSESSSMNNNSNSNNSGSSSQVLDSQSRIEVSRAEIQLRSSVPGDKTTQPLPAQKEEDQKDSSKGELNCNSSQVVTDSSVSASDKTRSGSGSAMVKDLGSNQDATQVVQSKDKIPESASKTSQSSNSATPKPKDVNRSNQDSYTKDKSTSGTAGTKASPNKQTGKTTTKSEKLPSSQSKAASQQKSNVKSAQSPAVGGKRRTRSGGSTGDRASEGSPEDHDGSSQASPGVMENGRLPDSGSPVCDTNSEASNDSGRGGSVGETLVPLSGGDVVRYEFNFPSDLCGRLIGRGGKNIQQIKEQSGANVTLSSNPFTPEFQICCVQGMQPEVDRALMLIRKKFPLAQYPHLDMVPLTPIPPPAPVVLPEIMQLNLPEGVSVDIVVSAIVNAGHIFVQQPTHPTFPSLERLNFFMNACYGDQNVPPLPRPVDGGIICAAESDGQWYRAQVVQVYPVEDECDIKFVDYGGYSRVPVNTLKQIRSDFMTLPFQAVECYLANITPLQEEEYFSDKAGEVLGELTSGKMLQGQVIARGEDSICYVHLYQVSGHSVLMINREMVNREVVRWIEIL